MSRTLIKIHSALEQYNNSKNKNDRQTIETTNHAIYRAVSHKIAPNTELVNTIYGMCVRSRNDYNSTNNIETMKENLININTLIAIKQQS